MPGRILFVTWDGGGNVPPVLALGARLRARGHEVLALGSASLAGRFADSGIAFTSLDREGEWDGGALARDVVAAAADVDVVVADYMQPAALVGAEAADRPGIALVHTLYAANLDGSGGLLPMQMAGSVEGVSGVAESLGVAPIDSFGALLDRCRTVLVTSPEVLDLPGAPRAANVRFVGPVLEDAGPDAGWPPAERDDGRPLVAVGLGTTPMDEAPVIQRVLDGLADASVRVIVTLGAHLDRAELIAPPNAQLSGFVRHAALLPYAAALVCHGGLGSVLAALAHGVPLVCIPLGREQPLNADAVVRVGAGLRVDPDTSLERLRTAVLHAVKDRSLRAGAEAMRDDIAALDAADTAVRAIEAAF